MSGDRQHFIPRFLQKGFRAGGSRKISRCWVYGPAGRPRSANIADVGLQRRFYALEAETELDDKITAAESDIYAPLVELLTTEGVVAESVSLIPNMLVHFELRSRHVRQNMYGMMEKCSRQLIAKLADPETLDLLLQQHLQPGSTIFDEILKRNGISFEQFKSVFGAQGLPLRDVVRRMTQTYATHIATLIPVLESTVQTAVKRAHVRILNETLAPSTRVRRLEKLSYSIEKYPSRNLPLGDSIILFHVKGDRSFKTFLDKDDEIMHVVLPLTSDKYLLGTAENCDANIVCNLPEQVARCSMSYFISSEDCETLADLQAHIGSNAYWVSEKRLELLIEEVIRSLIAES